MFWTMFCVCVWGGGGGGGGGIASPEKLGCFRETKHGDGEKGEKRFFKFSFKNYSLKLKSLVLNKNDGFIKKKSKN